MKDEERKIILLGVKENEIVTADVCLTNRNGYNEFTCSFNVGKAFNIDNIDEEYKKNYCNDYWDSLDDTTKINCLDDGEITKDEYIEQIIDDFSYDYNDFIDCSCTNYEITRKDKTINFESISGGQHDIRKDDNFKSMKFTNEALFNDIMYLWDNYHLKEVTGDTLLEVIALLNNEEFEEYSEEFEEFIKNNIDWVVL